jgi:putative FmdB family regulatory protein
MPLYEYECDACGKRFEVIQKFSEIADTCAECGKGPVHRLASSPAIQFKGSGWYITDYAQKGKSESSGKSETADTTDKAKTEKTEKTEKTDKAAKTESKTEKKPDAASSTSSSPSSSSPKT